jgi:LPXTG-motif cell wall-anchored protein
VELWANKGDPRITAKIITNDTAEGENGPKAAEIIFTHSYAYTAPDNPNQGGTGGTTDPGVPPDPTDPAGPTDPGDTGGTADPTDPAPPPYTPSRPGGSYVLSDNGNYIELDENGTALGEWRYDPDGEIWIFEEYPPPTANLNLGGSLPQTGQLNWPVPVLAVFGALLFVVGWVYRRRPEGDATGPGVPRRIFREILRIMDGLRGAV